MLLINGKAGYAGDQSTRPAQAVSELAPLKPCSLLTRADRWPLETRAYMPIPLLVFLSADIARGSFSDRDKGASLMHKHVKTRLLKTLFYYTGACSSDLEWVMSLGFGFEDGQVFINLHHFWPWPFTVMFFIFFCWHSSDWSPSNYPSQIVFTSYFSREVLLALSSSEKGKLKEPNLVFSQRMPCHWCIKNNHSRSLEQKQRKIRNKGDKIRNERGDSSTINRIQDSLLI